MSLQKYSHAFFELADKSGAPCPQINALMRAIISYSHDVKLTEEAATELKAHDIRAVKGQKMSSIIDKWAKTVDSQFITHKDYNQRFNELCEVLASTSVTGKTIKIGKQEVTLKRKPKKETYGSSKTSTADESYTTGDVIDCIQGEIDEYESIVEAAQYETEAAKECIDNIILWADALKELQQTAKTSEKAWTLENVKQAYFDDLVSFYSNANDKVPSKSKYAIHVATNNPCHTIWVRHGSQWIDTNLRVNNVILADWTHDKDRQPKKTKLYDKKAT
jgi:hypothetical protein